jgi:hypothetical protein
MSIKSDNRAEQPLDPFAPENMRIPPNFGFDLEVQKQLNKVPVTKPNKQWWIRTHPTMATNALIIELEHERENYLVVGEARVGLAAYATPRALRVSITRPGMLFIWPLKLPDPSGRQNDWNVSALGAAKEAERHWVSIVANLHLGAYEVRVAPANIPDPQWGEVPGGRGLTGSPAHRIPWSFD